MIMRYTNLLFTYLLTLIQATSDGNIEKKMVLVSPKLWRQLLQLFKGVNMLQCRTSISQLMVSYMLQPFYSGQPPANKYIYIYTVPTNSCKAGMTATIKASKTNALIYTDCRWRPGSASGWTAAGRGRAGPNRRSTAPPDGKRKHVFLYRTCALRRRNVYTP